MTPEEFLKKYRFTCFYHFTDRRNIPSIRAHGGLLPRSLLRAKGIPIPAPGGNQWSHEADDRRGLDAYIHLCVVSEHPMEYRAREEGRLKETTFLQIDAGILRSAGVKVSDRVSNHAQAQLLNPPEAFESLDFDPLVGPRNWKDPEFVARFNQARKYEILIPTPIPLSMILGGW